ncbi:E3 ubiquitin-protein ligase Os03g0188200-like [Typha latifolia]|uniref:E3 ubiquitin-protein ligase Os03g0188200-like n=1 Tax=Typha latifolia TaxID=4733 RepID=UPI003C2CCE74
MPTNDRRPILPLLLLLVTARSISSQPLPPPPTSARFSPSFTLSAAIIFITLIFAFFFLSFFSVYIRRCAENHLASAAAAEAAAVGGGAGGVRRRGLDPEVLESLPTMVYAAVKGIKAGKGPLECAICLSEFESDEETLRLLPGCCHVFHAECIDPWFASHVTCPVCRSNLSDPAVLAADRCLVGEEASVPPDIGVSVETEEIDVERPDLDRISRRRSQSAEGEDRYTLRLPEHVRMEIEEEVRHRRAASLAGMASSRSGNGHCSSSLRTVSGRRKRGEGEAGEGSCKRIFPLNGTPIGEHSGGGGENVESANVIGSHPERYYAHTVTLTGFVFQGDVAASDWNPDIFQVSTALQSPPAPQ